MLSFFYVGVDPALTPAVFPLAFFFCGVVQLIPGAAEFRQGSTLGATAFCSYGAFWMAYALYGRFVAGTRTSRIAHVLHRRTRTAHGARSLSGDRTATPHTRQMR